MLQQQQQKKVRTSEVDSGGHEKKEERNPFALHFIDMSATTNVDAVFVFEHKTCFCA